MCKRIVLTRSTLEMLDNLGGAGRMLTLNALLDYSFGREVKMTGMEPDTFFAYMAVRKDSEDYEKLSEKRTAAVRARWDAEKRKSGKSDEDANHTNHTNHTNDTKSDIPDEASPSPLNPPAPAHDAREDMLQVNNINNNNILGANAPLSEQSSDPALSSARARKDEPEPATREEILALPEGAPLARFILTGIVAYYNRQVKAHGSGLRRCQGTTPSLGIAISARRNVYKSWKGESWKGESCEGSGSGGLAAVLRVIDKAVESRFLSGGSRNGAPWGLQDLMRPQMFQNTLEGKYDNRGAAPMTTMDQQTIATQYGYNDRYQDRRGWDAPRLTDEDYIRLSGRPDGYDPRTGARPAAEALQQRSDALDGQPSR